MKSPMIRPCFVYVIAAGDLVKIGVANDPGARLKRLSVASPYKPRLVATRAFPSRRRAFDMEVRLHRLFHGYRENGEWFRITADHAERSLKNVQLHGDGTDPRKILNAVFSSPPKLL